MPDIIWPRTAGPLTLRPPTVPDIEQALTWRNSPEVTCWLLRTTVDPGTYTRSWLEEDPDSIGVAAHVDGELVGTGSLDIVDAMGQVHAGESIWRRAQAGIGYTIDPAHAGRGYATHLARALLSIAFDDLGLHRVTAGCFADNTPSWRAMERIGMRREQHGIKDSWHAELGWLDGYTYGILCEEWAEVSGAEVRADE
ncbi:GNAT family N-acetyltransferase [Janibacter limosus]|jgi:RimJ/RimL family protein N-acetyltransferase|uniref:GNAT family N-acetyltransferase n=1 Tax=Janibacter limosus TaxID=53458 RepID=UPI000833FEBC|nr:GNAT family protein [Janibacter limosus]